MLSDDITGTIGKGASMTGSVIGGAIRGALLGAVIAVAGVAIVAAAPAIWGFVVGGAAFSTIGAAITGAFGVTAATAAAGTSASVAAATAGGLALLGAEIGAAILGITSIIPGTHDLMNMGKSGARSLVASKNDGASQDTDPQVMVNVEQPVRAPAPQRPVVVNTTPYAYSTTDNYAFKEGRGAAAMQKGDTAEVSISRS